MSTVVVDASVAAKWFLPEERAEAALRVLGRDRMHAPDLIWSELANIVWKHTRRGSLLPDEARDILTRFLRCPLEIQASNVLMPLALSIALVTGRSVYDCLYVALAVNLDCECLTGDERLVNSMRRTEWGGRLRILGE